jgi:hypothetical protein
MRVTTANPPEIGGLDESSELPIRAILIIAVPDRTRLPKIDLRQPARLPEFAAVLLDHAGRILVISESDKL